MSATETALAAIRWAQAPGGGPPRGDFEQIEALLKPAAGTRRALGELAATGAARLGLRADGALDPAALLLALAVGTAAHPQVLELLRALDPNPAPIDLVTRHTLLAPMLPHLPAVARDELLATSPLTALLSHPARGEEDSTLLLGEQVVGWPGGRRLLTQHFARPSDNVDDLRWQSRVMDALRLQASFQALVLDIYEAAVALYAGGWLRLLGRARSNLAMAQGGAPSGRADLDFALAVGAWWEPFLRLYRAQHQAIRSRSHLDFRVYLEGFRLAQTTISLKGFPPAPTNVRLNRAP